MKTLGCILEKFLIQIVSKIFLVLFIILNALKLLGATLEESIFGLLENRRVSLEKLEQKAIGKNTMDPAQNSKKM